ncbi:MAG: hypothetical protein KDK65_00510 [Chlamydiia bacterium]|nr:hypothetical protein [Chlamydiia bacterium]
MNSITNEFSQGGDRFVLKSKGDGHLSVKIERPEVYPRKMTFTATQLSQMNFRQEILSNSERVAEFVMRYVDLFRSNPLGRTHPLGFGVMDYEGHPFSNKHPEWCYGVQQTFPQIRDHPLYQQRVVECQNKLGLTGAEEGVSAYDRNHLDQIKKAIETLLAGNQAAIRTIHEHVYQLLIMPIREVLEYTRRPHQIFCMNQFAFRGKLAKIDGFDQPILERVLSGMIGDLNHLKEQLEREFPSKQEYIRSLITEAQRLLDEEVKRALAEIKEYWNGDEVNACLQRCFQQVEHLSENFQNLLQERYASPQEMPRGFSDGRIHRRSYLPKLVRLLHEIDKKETLQVYLKDPEEYLQRVIVPLLFFGQCVKNILQWPRVYPLSDGERRYILSNLRCLKEITGGSDIKIPYAFLRLSETEVANAKKKKTRDACRTLMHARIPWQALCTIGTLLHRSGGVSEADAKKNRQRVSDVLDNLFDELQFVDRMIDELIAFEVTEFSGESLPQVAELPKGSYKHLFALGCVQEKERSLAKINTILSQWYSVPQVSERKFKYALLRTLQILGEMCKNLGDYALLGEDDIWEKLEELRDFLAHTERPLIAKRLEKILEKDQLFSLLQDNCRTLADYFKRPTKGKAYFELKGIEQLYMQLTEKISQEKKEELLATATSQQARAMRSRVAAVKSALGALLDTLSLPPNYIQEFECLPLTKGQKEQIRKLIQTVISPKAAENNVANEKQSLLKSMTATLTECLKSPKLTAEKEKFEQIINRLAPEHIEEVRALLQSINWGDYKKTKIDEMIPLLDRLNETAAEYVKRKTQELERLINEITLVESAEQLIDDLQLGRVTKDALAIRLAQLGITDQKVWNETHTRLQKKASPEKQEVSSEITLIDAILLRLKWLGHMCPKGDFTALQKDPYSLLACEYHVGDVRAAASALEDRLETLRQSQVDLPQQMMQEIQQTLRLAIAQGNEVLHVHDVTEPDTRTPEGHIFYLHQYISQLVVNATSVRGVSIYSLAAKLEELKRILCARQG